MNKSPGIVDNSRSPCSKEWYWIKSYNIFLMVSSMSDGSLIFCYFSYHTLIRFHIANNILNCLQLCIPEKRLLILLKTSNCDPLPGRLAKYRNGDRKCVVSLTKQLNQFFFKFSSIWSFFTVSACIFKIEYYFQSHFPHVNVLSSLSLSTPPPPAFNLEWGSPTSDHHHHPSLILISHI